MRISDTLFVDERELKETFVTAQGPGGQNVNKVASAVELRFNRARSTSFPPDGHAQLTQALGNRLTTEGELIVRAQRFRDQPRNREDARQRLARLLAQAAERQTPRVATRPTRASVRRRLADKAHAAGIKAARRAPDGSEPG
jgi:ribosome-associated protein